MSPAVLRGVGVGGAGDVVRERVVGEDCIAHASGERRCFASLSVDGVRGCAPPCGGAEAVSADQAPSSASSQEEHLMREGASPLSTTVACTGGGAWGEGGCLYLGNNIHA